MIRKYTLAFKQIDNTPQSCFYYLVRRAFSGNGTIEFEEFVRLMVERLQKQTEDDDLRKAFEVILMNKMFHLCSLHQTKKYLFFSGF